jgi:hypothetical protein
MIKLGLWLKASCSTARLLPLGLSVEARFQAHQQLDHMGTPVHRFVLKGDSRIIALGVS